MTYFGKVEVEVRLLRQGHGEDSSGTPGSGFAVHATRTVEIPEHVAKALVSDFDSDGSQVGDTIKRVVGAVKAVLDEDDMDELQQRWREATRDPDADKMRAALAVLEGRA